MYSKIKLRGTQMHLLPGLPALRKYFFTKGMDEEKIPTLQQFFEWNLIPTWGRYCFRCDYHNLGPTRKGLHRYSKAFISLRQFLLDNGFDHNDWCMLLPKTTSGELDYGKLKKNFLISLPVARMVSIQTAAIRTSPFAHIAEKLWKKDIGELFEISVHDVLRIRWKQITGEIKKDRRMMTTLQVIQKTFRSWGLTGADGTFMQLPLYVQPKGKAQWIEYLIQQRAFEKEEAEKLFNLAEKANVRMTVL